MKKLLTLLLFAACLATAQTTLITPPAEGTNPGVPFACDPPQDQQKPFTFYQFECRGVPFNDSNNNPDGKLFWFTVLSFYGTFNDVAQPVQGGSGTHKYKIDYFTAPANGNPGTFGVEFQFIDANSLYHYGVWSGTWQYGAAFRSTRVVLESSRIDNYQESGSPILN